MKVLLTSPNTTALPAVQRASTGTGSLQEGCCCDEAEILLKRSSQKEKQAVSPQDVQCH